MATTITANKKRVYYDCTKCPGYCCSIYDRVQVTKRDLTRLAKHFGVSEEIAAARYTKMYQRERILRRKKDPIFGKACKFLDPETRRCTIYHGRPSVCREYPDKTHCNYYDLIQFERTQQDDPLVVPVVQITFRQAKKKQLT
jgi:Fe-S-cluster containining protein